MSCDGGNFIGLYVAKCGDIFGSRKVFDNMPDRNVVTWKAMIGGYIVCGDMKHANLLFEKMPMRSTLLGLK